MEEQINEHDIIVNNLIILIQDYITIENNLDTFPLRVGDIGAMVRYTDSHSIQKKIFDKLIEGRRLEKIENHEIVKNIINIDPNTLNELDLVLQKGINNIINKINEQIR